MAEDEDPWGFAARKKPERLSAVTPAADAPAEPAPEPAPAPGPATDPPVGLPVGGSAGPVGGSAGRGRGELRGAMPTESLRQRAWPLALALALVSVAGFLTEVVAASQTVALGGPRTLLVVYPLGGIGLVIMAVLQFKYIDARARLPVLRAVSLGYAVLIAGALALLLGSIVPVLAAALIWLLADQLNFLVPLLIWSLAGDEFNVAEGRKVFGWIITWTYAGQVIGLVIATAGVPALTGLGAALPLLLVIVPVLIAFVGVWLPRRMAGRGSAKGLARPEDLKESLRSAADFINGVPVWRSLLIGSILTFVAGMMVFIAFMADGDRLLGGDAAELQLLFGGVSLGSFLICWGIQALAAERLQERLGIPGVLLVLPLATAAAGAVMAIGSAADLLPVVAAGIVLWFVPRWSIDENARRAALTLVPDERRTRVSFVIDLAPVAIGLILAGPLAALGVLTGAFWLVPVIAGLLALAAVPYMITVRRGWEDSLLNWRLRRRKRSRGLEL